jgi:amino-acid N-acetyltransferase
MHNLALAPAPAFVPARFRTWRRTSGPVLAIIDSAQPFVRAADETDVDQITDLVNDFAADGSMLPRTSEQVSREIDQYVVVADHSGHVLACAALTEYSPSLAEVSSVAVTRAQQGLGYGTLVVQGVEQMARVRDYTEVFALSLSDGFFASLGYNRCEVERYPEKLARWKQLAANGIEVVPKRCFRKTVA